MRWWFDVVLHFLFGVGVTSGIVVMFVVLILLTVK